MQQNLQHRCRMVWFVAMFLCVSPTLFAEKVLLKTRLGDLTLRLDPSAAPQTVAHFMDLFRSGCYDGTHFFRIERGFVAQISPVTDRLIPLTEAQKAKVQNVPLEIDPTLRHHRGTLSVARFPDNPNSGESSFSILLGDAPHLDGQYTIVGELEKGFDVLLKIESEPLQPGSTKPLKRLTLEKAVIIKD